MAAKKSKGKKSSKATKAKVTPAGEANGSLELHKPVLRKTYTQKLPVPVGDDVVEVAAREMAKLHHQREELKEERRTTMAGFKERGAHLDQRMGELADTVNKSTVLADVLCDEFLTIETNEITVVRKDNAAVTERRTATAKEIEETRMAQANARQENLFDGAPPKADEVRFADGKKGRRLKVVPPPEDDVVTYEQSRGPQPPGLPDPKPGDGG